MGSSSPKRPKPALPELTIWLRLSGETRAELDLYAELFEEQFGERIASQQIAVEILVQHIEKDRELRRRKRGRSTAAGASSL